MAPEPRTPPAMARANGLSLCHESFGDPGAAPLLLIMGLGGQMVAWDDMVCRQRAARGDCVIRYDPRDIGLSAHFHDAGAPGRPGPGNKAMGVLLKPVPTDRAAYVSSVSETWKLLRGGDFPRDETRDAAHAV